MMDRVTALPEGVTPAQGNEKEKIAERPFKRMEGLPDGFGG
jgi:hypothetical protein